MCIHLKISWFVQVSQISSQKTCIRTCDGFYHGHSIGFRFIKMCHCFFDSVHCTHSFDLCHSYLWIATPSLGGSIIYTTYHSFYRSACSYLTDLGSFISSIDVCTGSASLIGYSWYLTPKLFNFNIMSVPAIFYSHPVN